MKFNERIADIRKYLNLSNAGLEKKLLLSNGYISNIEKNGTDNPGKLLIALSKIGISTDWFLTGQGVPFILSPHVITAQEATDQALEAIAKKTASILGKEEKSALENELPNTPSLDQSFPSKESATIPENKADKEECSQNNSLKSQLFTGNPFPPKPPAETSTNGAEQAANSQGNKPNNRLFTGNPFPPKQSASSPVKETVLGGIEALAREAVAPALTAIEEKIADTASTLATHTTQSETVLAAHTQQLNEISAALRKLQELSGQPLKDMIHAHTPLYTAEPRIRTVTELEPTYTVRTEEDDEELPTTRLPLIENLAAGVPREMVDTYETYPVPTSYLKAHKTYFVAKIHGTSMTEAGIADGCHVLLEAKETPESGDIVIARYENQTTLKRLKQRDDGRWELLYEDGSRAKIELIDPDWAIQAKFIRVV